MVAWKSTAEMLHDAKAFNNLIHALLGLYMWEWATSLDFEWSILCGRKRFRWPLIFYFLGRYSLFAALIGIAISLNVTTEVNCQSLYLFNAIVGNAAIGFASVNLALRTIAVWEQRWYIICPLVVLMLGQWSFLLHGVLITADWIPEQGCVIVNTQSKSDAIAFIWTMCFDAIVMCLTAYKLATTGGISRNQRSRLVDMIFSDGLVYFIIAFGANTISTVFMLMNLNPIMSIIFNVPSAIVSTIVASRAVRRLSNFLNAEPERFGATKSSLAFRPNNSAYPRSGDPGTNPPSGTITVAMETFTRASDPGYASFAKEGANSDLDLESQTEVKGYGTAV